MWDSQINHCLIFLIKILLPWHYIELPEVCFLFITFYITLLAVRDSDRGTLSYTDYYSKFSKGLPVPLTPGLFLFLWPLACSCSSDSWLVTTLRCVSPWSSVEVGHVECRLSNCFHFIQRWDKCRVAVPIFIFLHRFRGRLPWGLSLLHVLFIRTFLFLLKRKNEKQSVFWFQHEGQINVSSESKNTFHQI